MKIWIHKLELTIDKLVPLALMVLLGVVIIEIFFENLAFQMGGWILVTNYFVISIFLADVIFKYIRIKKFNTFLRESWLDIIAIFPFAMLFRVIEGFFEIFAASEFVREGKHTFHEVVGLEKEVHTTVKKKEKQGKVTRTGRFSKIFKPIARFPRFLKAFVFYESPDGGHYLHEPEHKKAKKLNKSKR